MAAAGSDGGRRCAPQSGLGITTEEREGVERRESELIRVRGLV